MHFKHGAESTVGQMERLGGERPVPRESGTDSRTSPWEIKTDFSPELALKCAGTRKFPGTRAGNKEKARLNGLRPLEVM